MIAPLRSLWSKRMTTAPLISRLFIYIAIGAVIAGAAMPHHAAAASFDNPAVIAHR